MGAQMCNIYVADWWNNLPAMAVREATNPPKAKQNAADMPLLGDDNVSLEDNNILHPTHLER